MTDLSDLQHDFGADYQETRPGADLFMRRFEEMQGRVLEAVYVGFVKYNGRNHPTQERPTPGWFALAWSNGITQAINILGVGVVRVFADNAMGTVIEAHASYRSLREKQKVPDREWWMLHISLPKGEICIELDWSLASHPFMSIVTEMSDDVRWERIEDGDRKFGRPMPHRVDDQEAEGRQPK